LAVSAVWTTGEKGDGTGERNYFNLHGIYASKREGGRERVMGTRPREKRFRREKGKSLSGVNERPIGITGSDAPREIITLLNWERRSRIHSVQRRGGIQPLKSDGVGRIKGESGLAFLLSWGGDLKRS